MIPFSHVLYIPLSVAVGFALGWMIGRASAWRERNALREQAEELARIQASQRLATLRPSHDPAENPSDTSDNEAKADS